MIDYRSMFALVVLVITSVGCKPKETGVVLSTGPLPDADDSCP